MANHLAIFVGTAIEDILEGRKAIECRLSQKQVVPYGVARRGDTISLKQAGGRVIGEAQVENVLFFTTDEIGIEQLRRKYNRLAKMSRVFWSDHAAARYASVIFLKNPRRYLVPLEHKKQDRRPWVVLG